MEQIIFNHNAQHSINEAMGIEETRGYNLIETVYQNAGRDVKNNAHITPSELLENALMLAETTNEQVFVGYVIGQYIQKMKCQVDQHNCLRLSQVLQSIVPPALPRPGQN